jgi:predicted amidophosphoribosyltransferase
MNEEPIKICSGCGAEYSVRAVVCADCGGKLVFPQDYEKRFVPLADEEERTLIREGSIHYLRELKGHLERDGIRSDIRFHGEVPGGCALRTRWGLYVAAADEATAREIDRKHWIRGAPDHASSFKCEEQELQGVCPACSHTIPEGAAECPECGLVVGSDDEVATCPDCDAEVGDEVKKCPSCGAEFE